MRISRSKLRRYLPLVAAAVLLGGCYFPGSFDAEIELSRNGLYKMSFDGYIVELNHYNDLRQKKIVPGDKRDKERIATVLRDFKRDGATKLAEYFQQGAYHVQWSKGGDIIRLRQIAFFRRNENMFSITFDKDKLTMTVRGKYIRKVDQKRLEDIGLNMQGVLRIKTDAPVVSHTATKVTKQGPITIYGWRINSMKDPSPKMVVLLR